MGEVRVVGIRVEQPRNQPVLLLRESNGDRYLPIWIGQSEAAAIALEQQGVEPPRPLTHDLIGHLLDGFGIKLLRVVITELKNSTYFARLILEQENELGRKLVEVDARPSDCLALAAHYKSPVYVAADLFDEVEDMTEVLTQIQDSAGDEEQG